MTRTGLITVTCAFLFASSAFAQSPLKGKLEFSTGGAFQSLTVSEGSTSESYMFMNIPVRVGYFVTEGLEFEAEIIASVWEDDILFNNESELAMVFSANASYNFANGARVRPFLLAGVGVADAAIPPIANTVVLVDADETQYTILNVGAGFKSLVGSRAALRVEYRLQSFPEDETEGLQGYTSHTVQVSVSLFAL